MHSYTSIVDVVTITQDSSGSDQGDNASAKISAAIPEEGKKWVGFDPTGLERAAKAARELNESRELFETYRHHICNKLSTPCNCKKSEKQKHITYI